LTHEVGYILKIISINSIYIMSVTFAYINGETEDSLNHSKK